MPPKKRSPDDVHDIWNVEIGKPYRGQIVEKIDIETTNLDNGKVKVKRLIYLDNEVIVIEETWHEYEDVFVDGKLLPYNEINFPSMDPADFAAPDRSKDDEDDEEKKKKRELLRQKAKDMLKQKGNKKPPETEYGNDKPNDITFDLDDMDSELNDPTITVNVRTPEGKKLHVNIKPTDTVQALKGIIETDHDIPIEDQNLSCNGNALDDPDTTMEDNGIKHGDIIDLEANDPTITVNVRTPEGKKLHVNIKPTDTVQALKETIENDHDIPIEDQNLSCNGNALDDPDTTMEDNGIKHGDIIDLEPNEIAINVRTPDDKTFSILVKPDDTVGCVKKRIQSDHGIATKNKTLSYEGKLLDDPDSTMKDLGVSDGDTLNLDSDATTDTANRKKPMNAYNDDSYPKEKSRIRILSPDSAWVYHSKASAPKEGEKNNLQGIWSTPPGTEAGTEPVEANIHPKNKEPKSDGKADVHGAYGYINGAKPDAYGVVDPANVVFYLPGQKEKDYSPDFEHVGWWSAPQSSSVTTVAWRFEGDDILHTKTHTVNVMGHKMTFVNKWTE